jgi:hypothetical protein
MSSSRRSTTVGRSFAWSARTWARRKTRCGSSARIWIDCPRTSSSANGELRSSWVETPARAPIPCRAAFWTALARRGVDRVAPVDPGVDPLHDTRVVAGEPRGIAGNRREGEHRSAPTSARLGSPVQEGDTGSFSNEDEIVSRDPSGPPCTVNGDALVRRADAADDDPAERGIEDHGEGCTERHVRGVRQVRVPYGPRGDAEYRRWHECTEAREELGTKPHGGSLYGAPRGPFRWGIGFEGGSPDLHTRFMIDPVGVSRRAVRRRLRETSCPDCEHPWEEHGSSTDERPTACGECQYEEDHAQQDPGREKCWNIGGRAHWGV